MLSMRQPRILGIGWHRVLYAMLAVWLVMVLIGFAQIVDYSNRFDGPLHPISHPNSNAFWSDDSEIQFDSSRPNLLVFLHPKCPCSRATTRELERLLATKHDQVRVQSVLYAPNSVDESWTTTDLVRFCESNLRAFRFVDVEGQETRRFGVQTSGHSMLFDPAGRLRFSGGVTAGRGHEGDNPGAAALLKALRESLVHNNSSSENDSKFDVQRFPVFGCEIIGEIGEPLLEDI